MVELAFVHLLAESVHYLEEHVPDYPALPFVLATVGLAFVVAFETIILSLGSLNDRAHDEETATSVSKIAKDTVSISQVADPHGGAAMILKAYLMEISISAHRFLFLYLYSTHGPCFSRFIFHHSLSSVCKTFVYHLIRHCFLS